MLFPLVLHERSKLSYETNDIFCTSRLATSCDNVTVYTIDTSSDPFPVVGQGLFRLDASAPIRRRKTRHDTC